MNDSFCKSGDRCDDPCVDCEHWQTHPDNPNILPPTGHPLQRLGARLVDLLDGEQFANMEEYLLAAWCECKKHHAALDGQWTAIGMSAYARKLEDALNAVLILPIERIADAYVIAGEALALRHNVDLMNGAKEQFSGLGEHTLT